MVESTLGRAPRMPAATRDADLADRVRACAAELNMAVEDARESGLQVRLDVAACSREHLRAGYVAASIVKVL